MEESYPSTYLLYGLSVELGARTLWNTILSGVKGVTASVYVSPSFSVMYTLLSLMSVNMSCKEIALYTNHNIAANIVYYSIHSPLIHITQALLVNHIVKRPTYV